MDYEKIEQNIEVIEAGSTIMTSSSDAEMYDVEELTTEHEVESNPALNEFLNSDFGSHQEQVIKKMMAAAAIASGSEASPEEVASQADASATSIKTAYKVSTGELDVTESAEIIIDQAAARLNTLIQEKLDMDFIGEKVVDVVSIVYPPAAQLKPYVKAVLKKAEPIVRKAITTGINTVATYAKKTVKSVSSKIKNFAKKLLA